MIAQPNFRPTTEWPGARRSQRQRPGLTLLRAQAQAQLSRVEQAVRQVYGPADWFLPYIILKRLEAYHARYPLSAVTRAQAALHEAGHFIAFQAVGLIAGSAEIYGTSFGRHGWSGIAFPWNSHAYAIWPTTYTRQDFLNDAQATLAGPIAEELFCGGDATRSIGELVEARIVGERPSELSDFEDREAWPDALNGAIALVEINETVIREIADRLEHRRRIFCADRPVAAVLKRVKRAPFDAPLSASGSALLVKIENALEELAR